MTIQLDINSDMGESYGRWSLGNDADLMEVITSANIACGWHGGDPAVMRQTVALAVERGVGLGAHVGLPDLLGFGRRRMAVTPDEIYDYTLYQAGALRAFAEAAGGRLQHVKPHGAFYVMCAADEALAAALCRAVKALGDGVVLFGMGEIEPKIAADQAVGYVREGYIDLNYDAAGNLVLERNKGAWDPDDVAARAVRIATTNTVGTIDGGSLPMDVRTICIHGDAPNSGEIARRVRRRLEEVGVEVTPIGAQAASA
ncbi:MAG TPA: 5-oxoprolinase subunit PxpA [Thermomicrobiales bacterium]|nr:5-oxoprolinase subunit PxpA [Thermomicrobiales bacterium]